MNQPQDGIALASEICTPRNRRRGWKAAAAALLALGLIAPGAGAAEVSPAEMQQVRQWVAAHAAESAAAPFSFRLDGKPWSGPGVTSVKPAGPHRTAHETVFQVSDGGLEARCVMVEYDEFPTVEWTVYFKNTGSNGTLILSDIQGLDVALERQDGGECTLHHWAGSQATPGDYRPSRPRWGPRRRSGWPRLGDAAATASGPTSTWTGAPGA